MHYWTKRPLALKLTVLITSIVILVVTFTSLISTRRETDASRTELELQAQLLLDTLSSSSIDFIYNLDADYLADLMHSLGRTGVTDEGLAHLSGLRELRYLALEDMAITGSGLGRLAGLTKLECLLLAGTEVHDVSLSNLAPMANLLWIDLENTAVSDAGLTHLKRFPRLQYVPAWQSSITPTGLRFFIERQPKAW